MNKFVKQVVLVVGIVFVLGVGIWLYRGTAYNIYEFDKDRDTQDILVLFKKDWYWLMGSPAQYDERLVLDYLTYRTPEMNPLYAGRMQIKVMRIENKFAGFIAYWRKTANLGKITFLYVQSEMRGKRYGQQLLAYAIDDLKRMGVKRVRLFTRTNNSAAHKLYNRFGFKETSRDGKYVYFEYVIL